MNTLAQRVNALVQKQQAWLDMPPQWRYSPNGLAMEAEIDAELAELQMQAAKCKTELDAIEQG